MIKNMPHWSQHPQSRRIPLGTLGRASEYRNLASGYRSLASHAAAPLRVQQLKTAPAEVTRAAASARLMTQEGMEPTPSIRHNALLK
mmetsp:Transcript_43367/g.85943  ORF Transcript_43367/g.85943 Transcript_43367/m.85943 type:complete len:87 (-) Transcript_43367:463-723(-)